MLTDSDIEAALDKGTRAWERAFDRAGPLRKAAMAHAPPFELIPGRLWIGSTRDAANEEWLRNNRVAHVLNVARESSDGPPMRFVRRHTLHAVDCPLNPILATHLPEATAFLDTAMRSRFNVLVHCRAGLNRSVVIALAYAVTRQLVPLTRSGFMQLVRRIARQRYGALHNKGFQRQLVALFCQHADK